MPARHSLGPPLLGLAKSEPIPSLGTGARGDPHGDQYGEDETKPKKPDRALVAVSNLHCLTSSVLRNGPCRLAARSGAHGKCQQVGLCAYIGSARGSS